MNEEIKKFLLNIECPEVIDIYDHIWKLLHQLNQTDFEDVVNELMMISDSNEIDSFMRHFREFINETVDSVIEEHGLGLVEDTPIMVKANLLEFFINIEHTEMISGCARLLESDETNPTELFCETVSIVNGTSVDDLIIYMKPVPDAVVANMRGYVLAREQIEEEIDNIDQPEIKAQYVELENYARVMGAQSTMGYVLAFQPDGRVGDEYKEKLQLYFHQLNKSSPESIAKELIALALSSNQWKSPQITVEENLHMVVEDLGEFTKIKQQVTHQLQLWKNKKPNGDLNVKG